MHNNQRTNWQRLCAASDITFTEYVQRTKVSGMWLLQPKRTRGVTRWIWAIVLFSLLLLGFYLSLQLWLKFYSYPILYTIASNLPITDVAFPGITVCSPKVVNIDRVRRYIQKLNIPSQYNIQQVAEGFEFINSFTDHNWIPTQPNATFRATDAVLRLNNITIYDAAVAVSGGCADFTKYCFWGTKPFRCTQEHEFLSFTQTTSYLGPCCSFNYNPQNSSYVPFSSNTFGIQGGLSFIGSEGSERNLSTGLIVLVHHPMDFVTASAAAVMITANSESFVEITPTVQSSSIEVLELSQNKRDCLTSNDLALSNYRRASCILNCQTEVMYRRCKCQPYFLPNIRQEYKECKLADTECYLKNYDEFKSLKCDHCLPNCYDVTYTTVSFKTDLKAHNYSIVELYSRANQTNDTFVVRVYNAKIMVPSIRKIAVMSWIGLLSDLGGVFNLCLGLSAISLVEFFYYCTYRLHKNYKNQQNIIITTQSWK